MSLAWPELLRSLCEGEVLPASTNDFHANLQELADLVRSEDADLSEEVAHFTD
jgi:hypothetical protein